MPATAEPPAPPTTTPQPASTQTMPFDAPRPGSARERLHQDMRKMVGIEPEKPKPASPPPKPATGAPESDETVKRAEPEPEGSAPPTPDAETPPAPPPSTGKTKVSPWKLVDEYKKKLADVESQLLQVRNSSPDPEKLKGQESKLIEVEKRNRELEEKIAFTDYRESKEFTDKYVAPYESAWKRAMSDLKELTIATADGKGRPVQPQDLLELVNMPLPKARELATQLFGDFADDVMQHRKEIRRLADEQQTAIEDAKKNSLNVKKQKEAEAEQARTKMTGSLQKLWASANADALLNKGVSPYIKELENDGQWNQSLDKGTKLFDSSFGVDPRNPQLTDEQREDIVFRHAALRNRVRAYGPMKLKIARLEKELAEANEKLGNYKNAEPSGGERAPGSAPPPKGTAMDQFKAELAKLAH